MGEPNLKAHTLARGGVWFALAGIILGATYYALLAPRYTSMLKAIGLSSAAPAGDDTMCPASAQQKSNVLFIGCGGFF